MLRARAAVVFPKLLPCCQDAALLVGAAARGAVRGTASSASPRASDAAGGAGWSACGGQPTDCPTAAEDARPRWAPAFLVGGACSHAKAAAVANTLVRMAAAARRLRQLAVPAHPGASPSAACACQSSPSSSAAVLAATASGGRHGVRVKASPRKGSPSTASRSEFSASEFSAVVAVSAGHSAHRGIALCRARAPQRAPPHDKLPS
mmetsp:Transcript_3391/g.9004  ORF Transcript_3391/g.9004 Transcript_3391/m.9004 type:complete len:206 (+) Transcript_3391:245-862(+)